MEISAAYLASQLCAALAMRSVNLCCTTLWSNLCLRIGFLAVFGFCKLVFLKIFVFFIGFLGAGGVLELGNFLSHCQRQLPCGLRGQD